MPSKPTPNPTLKKGGKWRLAFLKALEQKGNVSLAAHKAGIHRDTAYATRDSDPEFAAAWKSALEAACDAMELEARRRAVEGTLKPVYQSGKLVGKVREYSDTLLIFMLKAHRPEKFRDRVDNFNFDLTMLTDQQIEKLAKGESIYSVIATARQGGAGTPAAPGGASDAPRP